MWLLPPTLETGKGQYDPSLFLSPTGVSSPFSGRRVWRFTVSPFRCLLGLGRVRLWRRRRGWGRCARGVGHRKRSAISYRGSCGSHTRRRQTDSGYWLRTILHVARCRIRGSIRPLEGLRVRLRRPRRRRRRRTSPVRHTPPVHTQPALIALEDDTNRTRRTPPPLPRIRPDNPEDV